LRLHRIGEAARDLISWIARHSGRRLDGRTGTILAVDLVGPNDETIRVEFGEKKGGMEGRRRKRPSLRGME
jgi:hypothetical protein